MNTICKFNSSDQNHLIQNHSNQKKISAYDVIKEIGRDLQYESSREMEQNQLKEEILLLKSDIAQFNSEESKILTNKIEYQAEQQAKQRAELRQQLEGLKTKQSSEEKFQEINQSYQEKISQLKEEIKELKKRRTIQQSPSLNDQKDKIGRESIKILNRKKTEILQTESKTLQIESEIFQLKITKKRQMNQNMALTNQCAVLQETYDSLEVKQRYCTEQIEMYANQVRQKEAQRDETRAVYQEIQTDINDLIASKKSYLDGSLSEIKQFATSVIDEAREVHKQELIALQRSLNDSLDDVRQSNKTALSNLEEKRKSYYEKIKGARKAMLQELMNVIDDYWKFINDHKFRIMNDYGKCIYESRETLKGDNIVKTGTIIDLNANPDSYKWGLAQLSDGSFSIKSASNRWMFESMDKDGGDCVVETSVSQKHDHEGCSKWKIEPIDRSSYAIFNAKIDIDPEKRWLFESVTISKKSGEKKRWWNESKTVNCYVETGNSSEYNHKNRSKWQIIPISSSR